MTTSVHPTWENGEFINSTETREIPTKFYRSQTLLIDKTRLAERAAGDDRIPIALSSESAVERYDWWENESYLEVLDHSKNGVDLSYAKDGLPFLLNHDTDEQMGIVEDISVDADGVIRGLVRFSQSQRAQEIKQDMLDGIRKKISIGYSRGENYKQTKAKDGALPTRTYTGWLLYEASTVPIPADYSVGVGRSARGTRIAGTSSTAPAPKATTQERSVENEEIPGGTGNGAGSNNNNGNRGVVTTHERKDDAKSIREFCKAQRIDSEQTLKWIVDGRSLQEVKDAVLEIRSRESVQTIAPTSNGSPLSAREDKQYSILRAMNASISGDWSKAGLEREFNDHMTNELDRKPTGFYVPSSLRRHPFKLSEAQQRAAGILAVGTATQGAETVATELRDLIELLRARSVLSRMGVQILSGLKGNVSFPRQTGTGTLSWTGEAPGSDVSLSNALFDQVAMTPKTAMSATAYSRQLMMQSSFDIENFVRNDISIIHALGIDKVGIHGTGTGGQPTGVYVASGVNTTTFGGNLTYPLVVDMESKVESADADVGVMGYVTTPQAKKAGKTQLEFAVNGASKIWTGTAENGEMNGYRALASNQISKTLGTGSDHGLVFGVWSQMLVGEWGAFDLLVDPYTLAGRNLIRVVSIQLVDVAIRHAAAFTKALTLVPA